MQIWFNGILKDTITTSSQNWTPYSKSFDILTRGIQDLLFQGQLITNGNLIGFSNVSFKLITVINNDPVTTTPVVNNILNNGKFTLPALAVNTFKRMNQAGGFYHWFDVYSY